LTLPPTCFKALDKGKGIASEPLKRLKEKKCFKCHYCGHLQADCPNRRTLTIREVEEIQAIEEEAIEENYEEEDHTLVTLIIGELLVIQRALHTNKFPRESS